MSTQPGSKQACGLNSMHNRAVATCLMLPAQLPAGCKLEHIWVGEASGTAALGHCWSVQLGEEPAELRSWPPLQPCREACTQR